MIRKGLLPTSHLDGSNLLILDHETYREYYTIKELDLPAQGGGTTD